MYFSDFYLPVISQTFNTSDRVLLASADAPRHAVIFHPTAAVISASFPATAVGVIDFTILD